MQAHGPIDVALLKSWDFAAWKATYGGGSQLPYRMDYLEDLGFHLRWTDRIHQQSWQASRSTAPLRWLEGHLFPFAQAAMMARTIAAAPVTLAMFESEANAVAVARRAAPWRPKSVMAVVTCWLADILTTCSPARRRAYRWAYRSVDRIYYFSENQGAVLAQHLDASPEQLVAVPFGIDDEAFSPLGGRDGNYLLVVGRDRGRDWETTFEAVRNIGVPVKVCCRPADIRGLKVPANVEVLGYVEREVYRALLGSARVVAVATTPRVYPSGQSVLLEAMGMGRAVVATATPALAEYINDGVTALAVPPGDPAALRAGLLQAAEDEDLRHRLGAGGRAAVEAKFSARAMWGAIAADLMTCLAS